MFLLSSFLLALALCVDILVVSTTAAFRTKVSYRRGLIWALTFSFFHGAFLLTGALVGNACEQFIASVDHWVAFGLLTLVGGKMILDAFRSGDDESVLDLSRYWVICTLAVATSIDALVVGIGFGLHNTIGESLATCLILCLVTIAIAFLGVCLGKRNVPIPEKWASVAAGLVLIGLGTHTLWEHLCA